jgi:trans-aconitate methyltransferase/GNAT superfamily N-acetyltransferase
MNCFGKPPSTDMPSSRLAHADGERPGTQAARYCASATQGAGVPGLLCRHQISKRDRQPPLRPALAEEVKALLPDELIDELLAGARTEPEIAGQRRRHHLPMTANELDMLLAEQVAYYRARAPQYEASSPWSHDETLRAALVNILAAIQPCGEVLEFACGTGVCTEALAAYASCLDAVDVSPEMLAIASARVRRDHVHFIESDIFDWQPARRYDVVFFSAWLSHVPPQRFARFWALVGQCLKPDGRVIFIDELPAEAAHDQAIVGAIAPAVQRPLESGAQYRIVKVFHAPDALRDQLTELGWDVTIHVIGWRFYYAIGKAITVGSAARLVGVVRHELTEADPRAADVRELIARHRRFTGTMTPAEFAFALDHDQLAEVGVTIFGLRINGQLLAIGALKYLDEHDAELKSMHTAEEARGRGLGRLMLDHLLASARAAGCKRVSIETGSTGDFAPARALYTAAGFVACGPFGEYRSSDWNIFMSLDLTENAEGDA